MDVFATSGAIGELGTEIVRLVITFFFFTYIMRPIKDDVHSLRNTIQELLIKVAKMEDVKEETAFNKLEIKRIENMIHKIEVNCKSCKHKNLV